MRTPIPVLDRDLIDSTQLEARRLISTVPVPFWVRANTQSAGYGRSGRAWVSREGNYYATLVFQWSDAARAHQISFVAAFALFRVFESYGLTDLAIKWPNDVLIGSRKLAGLLLEYLDGNMFLGIGVNVANNPAKSEIDPRSFETASLNEFHDVTLARFHLDLEKSFVAELQKFQDFGFTNLRQAIANCLWVRSELVYEDGRTKELVRVIGLDDDGALEVEGALGRRKLFAGDLFPR